MLQIRLTKSAMCRLKQEELYSFLSLLVEATTSMEKESKLSLVEDLKTKHAELLAAVDNNSTSKLTKQIYSYCRLLKSTKTSIWYVCNAFLTRNEADVSETSRKVKEITKSYPIRKAKSLFSLRTIMKNFNNALKGLGNDTLDLIGIKQFVKDLDTFDAEIEKLYAQRTEERLRIKALKAEKVNNAIESVCNLINYVNGVSIVSNGEYDVFINKVNDIYEQSKYLLNKASDKSAEVENQSEDNEVLDNQNKSEA